MRGLTWPAVVALACIAASGCGGSGRHHAPRSHATGTSTLGFTYTVPATPVTTGAPKPKAKPNPGSLPQTNQLPSAHTPQFHAEMAALWSGITHDSLTAALPAFFPLGAYVQVKSIADSRADYTDRLLGEYRLDLAAAHALLGAHPQAARLLTVRVPGSYAHWVSPGACYNRVGYYEVPNARVVYRQGGAVRSFGIASLISWRGVWYVVHLGAVVRAGSAGVVDGPSSGAGESPPSSTC